MRKFTALIALLLLCGMQLVFAQSRVTGTVLDKSNGSPIPGTTILEKGTTNGTLSANDGKYDITVSDGATLVFRFIGMKSIEIPVGSRTNIDVELEYETQNIEGIVITAIGISRKEKALGYSATSVGSEELNRAAPISVMNSLQGKVAGVRIASTSGAPGASTSVIVRGFSSLNGDNQPLYVVDGSPIENSRVGGESFSRSNDFGNAANDINPDNIENVTILKGATATALYGSRAANGVVMITTKGGKIGSDKESLKVDFSSSADFSTPLRTPQLQNTFGQGWSGHWDSQENGSWGPRMDGTVRPWGNVVDDSQLIKPFEAQENNLNDFYTLGQAFNNTVTVSGGSKTNTFLVSYNNVASNGIIPTDADSYKRNGLTLKGGLKVNKFSVSGSANYINKNSQFVTTGQGTSTGATMFQEIIQTPRDLSIVDMIDYENKFYNPDNFYTPYAQNPYFVLNENGNDFISERFYGNTFMKYDFTKNLFASARFSTDILSSTLKDWQAVAIPGAGTPNEGSNIAVGGLSEQSRYSKEFNTDLMLNYTKELSESFNLSALLGANILKRDYRSQITTVEELTVPNFYNLSNSPNAPTQASSYYEQKRLIGVYSQIDLAYNDYLFLNLVARNDFSSTLPEDNNSFFYPGVGLSFVLTDAIDALHNNNVLSFARLRSSWGKTGNDADPYQIYSTLVAANVGLGFGEIAFPLAGVSAFEIGNTIGNNELEPEITSEWEVGADLRFFNSRLAFDFAYYSKKTDGQIMQADIAPSSGYTLRVVNLGLVSNKGIELSATVIPIRTNDWKWELNYTYTKNNSLVEELPDGLDKYLLQDAYGIEFNAVLGEPLGVFSGHAPKYTEDGQIIVDASTGIPVNNEEKEVYGNSQADYMMGLRSSLTYKSWSLGATVDYQKGGLFYSYTARLNYFVGNATNTLYNDRNPFIVPNSVVETTNDDGDIVYVENTTMIDKSNINEYWNQTTNNMISREHVLDKTFFKLREVTLAYSLPQSLVKKTPFTNLSLTLFGRNLLLWTPSDNNFIDPESTNYGNDLSGMFGEFAVGPTVRSFGVKLNLSF